MYVEPAVRGSGVATLVLRALEDAARARGVRRMLLETGTAQPEALRFYLREGYARIEPSAPTSAPRCRSAAPATSERMGEPCSARTSTPTPAAPAP